MNPIKPWLHIIGIGEDGVAGLSQAAQAILAQAEILIGGARHHALIAQSQAERIAWPSPFDALIETITMHRGKTVVVLATGDPLWYSVGARINRLIANEEICFYPQLSAFQWAACRMGWSLADVETLTVHGRPIAQILPFFAHEQRLLLLTKDQTTPPMLAALLTQNGFGRSKLTVLAHLGGKAESRIEGIAQTWSAQVPDFHTLAVEVLADLNAIPLPRMALPDDAFIHDGKLTKQDIRAVTLARLAPQRGELLWDIGAGCGSIGIEWMRANRDMQAIGLEPHPERRAMAQQNAQKLGTPRFVLQEGIAPEALHGLPNPHAVFIGGGLSEAVFDTAWHALRPYGRLVANAVTLDSETLLMKLHQEYGGDLSRLSIAKVTPIGNLRGWRPLMPVTQWVLHKGGI